MLSLVPNSERVARRKFELSQKINNNDKLLGGLVHYLSYLVAGQWVPLKPPRREGSRKLTSDYLRHLTAARRVLRLRVRKQFSPDGGSHCEYYLSPSYETQLYATTGLNLDDHWTRAGFDSLPCGFKLSDLREFSDRHPDLLERAKAFLAKDFLQSAGLPGPSRPPAPTLSPNAPRGVTQTGYEQHKREAWLNRNFGIEL
jgi:hypothetical protein